MSLSTRIAAALDENTRALNLPARVSVEDERLRLALDLTALDGVGLAFERLSLSNVVKAEHAPAELARRGQAISSKVTYLMEPLRVLELAPEGQLQIRSDAPTTRAEKRSYYEILLERDGGLSMVRFAYDEASRSRSQIACQFTREVLERLVDDLAAVCR